MRPVLAALLTGWVSSAGCSLPAQQLVRDIEPGTLAWSSNPQVFTTDSGRAFFRATTVAAGSELWTTDGTHAGTRMVVDLVLGSAGSAPWPALQTGGRLLFWATVPGLGMEPWSTDGTAAGTFMLAEVAPGTSPTSLREFGAVNGRVVFWHSSGRLLSADLSQPGVTILTQGIEGDGGITHNGLIYFIGADGQPWVTDATLAGTHRLLPSTGLNLRGLFPGGSHMLMFVATAGGTSLWRTDGTVAGTGPVGPAPAVIPYTVMQVGNGAVFFGGSSVWFCNASTPPTAIATLAPQYAAVNSYGLGTIGGRAVVRLGQSLGSDLCTTDGTTNGTYFLPLPGPGSPNYFVSDGVLGYMTRASGNSSSLWVTDGTPGLLQQAAVLPGISSGMWFANGRALLALSDPTVGNELFGFDPQQGLQLLRDIATYERGLSPSPVAALGERLFFLVPRANISYPYTYRLWASDGTPAGTDEVVDYGPDQTSWPPAQLTTFADRVVFAGSSPSHVGLFESDGTRAGTLPLLPSLTANAQLRQVRAIDGQLWWIDDTRRRVYRSDGTLAGTEFVQLPTAPYYYEVIDDLLFAANSFGITRSDFTPSGTWLVDPGVPSFIGMLGRLGQRVLYSHYAPTGHAIRSTDGTIGGSALLLQLPSNNAMTIWDGHAWFRTQFSTPALLWRTDGRPSGSTLVGPLPAGVDMDSFRPAHDGMYFIGADAVEGAELWRCTGRPGGTTRVVSLLPGQGSGVRAVWPVGTGHRFFLVGGDHTTGSELFVSDGTQSGTTLVADIAPGPASSNPEFFGIAGPHLFFLADDGVVGKELWVVDLATLAVANVQPLWGGCGGSEGQPRLTTLTAPRLGEAGFGFRVERVPPGAAVVLAKSTTVQPTALGACSVLPGGAFVALAAFANDDGSAAFTVPVPPAVSLLGFSMVAQAAAVDLAGAGSGFAISDALLIVVGS